VEEIYWCLCSIAGATKAYKVNSKLFFYHLSLRLCFFLCIQFSFSGLFLGVSFRWCQWQWQCHWRAEALRQPPRPQVADRGMPSRMDKRVAPDKEGAADKQCLRRRKTLIPNQSSWSSLSLFRQIHLGEGKL